MAIGSRRSRGGDEYIFVDGRAMKADEVVRINVDDTAVPGQKQAAANLAEDEKPKRKKLTAREALKAMNEDDGFALAEDAQSIITLGSTKRLMQEDRKKTRTKCVVFGVVLLAVFCVSMCFQTTTGIHPWSPAYVVKSLAEGIRLFFIQTFDYTSYAAARDEVMTQLPLYQSVCSRFFYLLKYVVCGAMLALSGMLYQNTFRNPIAAPSMLGVTNGISFALIILVFQFGWEATEHVGLYYLYAFMGGLVVLILVIAGGKFISGRGRFNVVNMILMGTIISQLLSVVTTYLNTNFLTEDAWNAYYQLQNAVSATTIWSYATLFVGAVVAALPIVLFRFRLNLISFSDEETRLLGVDPNRLRILALACGSIMILVAQINAGQVAMVSLVVPFVTRAVFGSEFRKQLVGNLLVGALVLLVCGVLSSVIIIDTVPIGLAPIVSIAVLPLFVWMLAIQQRSWE